MQLFIKSALVKKFTVPRKKSFSITFWDSFSRYGCSNFTKIRRITILSHCQSWFREELFIALSDWLVCVTKKPFFLFRKGLCFLSLRNILYPAAPKKHLKKILSSKYCQILTKVNYVFINSLILSPQWTLLIPTWSGFVTCLFGVIPPVLDLLYGHYPLHFKLQLYFCQLPLFYHTISLVIKYRSILTAVYRFWAFQNLDTQNKVS